MMYDGSSDDSDSSKDDKGVHSSLVSHHHM